MALHLPDFPVAGRRAQKSTAVGCEVGLGSLMLGRKDVASPFEAPALRVGLLVLLVPGVATRNAVPGPLSLLLPVSQEQVLDSGKCVRKEARASFKTAQGHSSG